MFHSKSINWNDDLQTVLNQHKSSGRLLIIESDIQRLFKQNLGDLTLQNQRWVLYQQQLFGVDVILMYQLENNGRSLKNIHYLSDLDVMNFPQFKQFKKTNNAVLNEFISLKNGIQDENFNQNTKHLNQQQDLKLKNLVNQLLKQNTNSNEPFLAFNQILAHANAALDLKLLPINNKKDQKKPFLSLFKPQNTTLGWILTLKPMPAAP